ncbi:MAG: hypothetical protein OHK006_13230 [Thermodesulfovibrionales bacterium]
MADVKDLKVVVRVFEQGATAAFEKIITAVDKCKSSFTDLYFKVKSTGAGLSEAFQWAELGAKALQAEESFRNVAAAYGESADAMLAKMKEVSAGIIDDSSLQQRAIKGLQQGLTGSQLTSILEISRSAARVAGTGVEEAFDGLTNAIANQATRGMKAYGIVIDQKKANEEYAKSLNKVTEELTEQEQAQALANAAIQEGQRQMQAMGPISENYAEKLQQARAQMHELKETIGKGLLLAMQALGGLLYWVVGGFLTLSAVIWKVLEAGLEYQNFLTGGMIPALKEAAQAAGENAKIAFEKSGEYADKGMKLWQGMGTTIDGQVGPAIANMNKQQQESARNTAETTRALAEWQARIEELDPSLSDLDKQILSLTSAYMKTRDEFRKNFQDTDQLDSLFLQGVERLQAKAAQATENFMTEIFIGRQKGIAKDLLATDQWLSSTVEKFKGQGTAILAITEEWARRRSEIIKNAEQQIRDSETQTEDMVLSIRQKNMKTNRDRYASQTDRLWDKERMAGALDTPERIKMLQSLQQAWTGLTDEVKDGESVYLSQAQASARAIENIQRLGLEIKSLQTEELEKAKNLKLDNTQAQSAIDQIKSALESIPNETVKKLIVKTEGVDTVNGKYIEAAGSMGKAAEAASSVRNEIVRTRDEAGREIYSNISFTGSGSPTMPIGEKLDWIKDKMAGLSGSETFNVDFGQVTAMIQAKTAMEMKIAEMKAWEELSGKSGSASFNMALNAQAAGAAQLGQVISQALANKPLGSYATGTDFVPQTGPYLLHKGERVIPAGKSGGVTVSIGGITIAGGNKDPEQLAREIAKPLRRELQRLNAYA